MNTQQILQQIADLQSKGEDNYPSGLFPSQRCYPYRKSYQREDNNVFFTVIIVLTLQQIYGKLDSPNQQIADSIIQKALKTYPLYQNKKGIKTYNFWQTRPSKHWPNDDILGQYDYFRIPDDVDCTALIYLTLPQNKVDSLWLKNKLPQHTNGTHKHGITIKNTEAKYKKLKAYSTYFGEYMHLEFDFCAISNVLLWVFKNNLPLNETDYDSIRYITSVIQSDEHFSIPHFSAHSYPTTPLILYHAARLLSVADIPEVQMIRSKIIQDIRRCLEGQLHFMERIILSTSLLRLGETAPNLELPTDIRAAFEGFYFFEAAFFSPLEVPYLRQLSKYKFLRFQFRCEAYYWTLILEWRVASRDHSVSGFVIDEKSETLPPRLFDPIFMWASYIPYMVLKIAMKLNKS